MKAEVIKSAHVYNKWATERVLECAKNLPNEQFLAEDDTPWGSIRNQFVHSFNVHRSWLSWIDGSLPPEEAYQLQDAPTDYVEAESVCRFWERVWDQTARYFSETSENDLDRLLTVQWPNFEFQMPVWKVLLHIANHSMQHRTELTVSLTRLGQSPGDLDYIFFALEEDAQVIR